MNPKNCRASTSLVVALALFAPPMCAADSLAGTHAANQSAPAGKAALNPLARPAMGAPASPAAAQPQGGPGGGGNWKIHQHATGLSLRYPPDWALNLLPAAIQLIPPDAARSAAGATEAYFVLGEGAQGIASPEDPRVVRYFDQQLAQFAPFLRRTGAPERIQAGASPGILLTWDGTNPTGLAVRAHVFATILKGYAIAVLALGDRTKIADRDRTVRDIFASLAAGAGQKDPQLIGAWRYWNYSSSPDGKFGTTTDRRFVLAGDGDCQWSSSGESSGTFKEKNSLGDTVWTGGVVGSSASGPGRGQWSAAQGRLYVLWADGTTGEWSYEIKGVPGNRRLFLKGDRAQPDEWVEGN